MSLGKFEEYLGDGVYATFDGYQIWLAVERGPGNIHTIALEPVVFAALVRYEQRIREGINKELGR